MRRDAMATLMRLAACRRLAVLPLSPTLAVRPFCSRMEVDRLATQVAQPIMCPSPHWEDWVEQQEQTRPEDPISTSSWERRLLLGICATNVAVWGLWQLSSQPSNLTTEVSSEEAAPHNTAASCTIQPPGDIPSGDIRSSEHASVRGSNMILLRMLPSSVPWQQWRVNLHDWMIKNFVCTLPAVLIDGRWWVIGTATVSQPTTTHLFTNVCMLYTFGGMILPILGWRRFAALYVSSAIASKVCFFAERSQFRLENGHLTIEHPGYLGVVGASGVISALEGMSVAMFPMCRLYIFGLVPARMWMIATGANMLDLWGLYQGPGQVAFGSHLGGFAFGLLIGAIFRFRFNSNAWLKLLHQLRSDPKRTPKSRLTYNVKRAK